MPSFLDSVPFEKNNLDISGEMYNGRRVFSPIRLMKEGTRPKGKDRTQEPEVRMQASAKGVWSDSLNHRRGSVAGRL